MRLGADQWVRKSAWMKSLQEDGLESGSSGHGDPRGHSTGRKAAGLVAEDLSPRGTGG